MYARTICLVDDHAIFAQLLAHAIRVKTPHEPVVIVAGTQDVAAGIIQAAPDLVVLDLVLGDQSGLDVYRGVRDQIPDARWLALTGEIRPATIQKVLLSGVDGIVLKSSPEDEFLCGVEAVLSGESYLCPNANRAINSLAELGPRLKLTSREREVLQYLADGLEPGEIAAMLAIKERRARELVQSLRMRFAVGSNPALVRKAIESGIISV